jgi:hypothetical protein
MFFRHDTKKVLSRMLLPIRPAHDELNGYFKGWTRLCAFAKPILIPIQGLKSMAEHVRAILEMKKKALLP